MGNCTKNWELIFQVTAIDWHNLKRFPNTAAFVTDLTRLRCALCHDTPVPVMVNTGKAVLKGLRNFIESALNNAKSEMHF